MRGVESRVPGHVQRPRAGALARISRIGPAHRLRRERATNSRTSRIGPRDRRTALAENAPRMRRARRAALMALYDSPGYTGFKGSQISHRRALKPNALNGREWQATGSHDPTRAPEWQVCARATGWRGRRVVGGGWRVGRGAMAYDVRGVCLVVCDWMRCDTWVVYGRVIGGGW